MTRRQRWRRALIATAIGGPIGLIVLLVGAVLLLPVIVTDDDVKQEAVSALTDALGTPVKIDRLTYHPLSGIEIFGIVIGPPPGFQRDLARIQHVALRYDLSHLLSFGVTVNTLLVEHAEVVVEAKAGPDGEPVTNIDAIVAHRPKKPPAPPEEPKPPATGPLSPIDVVLEKLAIEDVAFEKVGVGPSYALKGLSIHSSAVLDQEHLHARLDVAIASSQPNVSFDDPGKSLSAKMQLVLTASTTVDAAASDGFDLGELVFGLKGALYGDAVVQGTPLPKLDVDIIAGVGVRPADDRLTFAPLKLYFSKATLVDLSASVVGLQSAMAELLGPTTAESLAGALGLERHREDDVATLSVTTIALPLDVLAPYAAIFVPGLSARGTIALAPLEVTGTVLDVIRGAPRGLKLRLSFDTVALDYPPADFSVRELGGGINLARSDDGKYYGLEGSLVLAGVTLAKNSAERGFLSTRAKVERLTYPPPGEADVQLVLSAEGVRAPPASIHRASVDVSLKGTDVLVHDRSDLPPIEATVAIKADHLKTVTGTATNELKDLALEVHALADRLIDPAKKPIEATIALALGSAVTSARVNAKQLKLDLTTHLSDPRTGEPISGDATLALTAAALDTPQASLDHAKIDLRAKADALKPRVLPLLAAPVMLPAFADVELDVALPSAALHDFEDQELTTSLALKTAFAADLIQGSVSLRSLALDVWNLVHLRANGRFAKLFQKERYVDAKIDLLPVDLARLLEHTPRALIERTVPGLRASGKLGLTVRAHGNIPEDPRTIDLGAPPLDAHVLLSSEDLSAVIPARKLELAGFGGRIAVDVSRGKSELTTDLSGRKLIFVGGNQEHVLEKLSLTTRAGLRGEMWEISTDLDARGAEQAAFDVDLTYVKHGDMQLRRFDVRLPGAGVELDIAGRLLRRTFGVLRPELALKAKLDLDKVRDLYPAVGDAHGVVGLNVDISAPTDTRAVVAGVLELAGFDYTKGALVLKGATGRIPIEQRFALREPIMRELIAGAEGVLGDDLEARLDELEIDFTEAQFIVDKSDIVLEAPRAADYQPLRPYFAEKGAHLVIASITTATDVLENIVLDGLYRSGVLRADRFAAQLWEGDVLGDLAVQLTSDLNVRLRQRGTITKLNLDIPYAHAKKIAPVRNPREKEEYEIAGTIDLRTLLHERTLTMKLDLTKLRKPTLERLLGYLDPKGTNPGMDRARWALSVSEAVGLRPVAGTFTIAQNLLSMNVEWTRAWWPEWLGFKWESAVTLLRVVSIPVVGSIIVGNVNGAFGDKFSISPYLNPVIDDLGLEEWLAENLGGRVIAEDLSEHGEVRTASP